ncbi:MAG: hypothetical protein LBC61_02965 [Candidatus Peribacteria bacterium]|nr:hypothetical protein [Candidatus Peribacteria bacterium]
MVSSNYTKDKNNVYYERMKLE